jgi:hypothetical protein
MSFSGTRVLTKKKNQIRKKDVRTTTKKISFDVVLNLFRDIEINKIKKEKSMPKNPIVK